MLNNKIKTKFVYRVDALEELYVDHADSKKYKFSETSFNEKGDVLLESEFDAEGNRVYQLKNEYNAKGLLEKLERSYYEELAEQRLFTYNSDDLVATEKIIYAGTGEKSTTYTYTDFKKPETKLTEDHSNEDPAMEEKFDYEQQQLIKHSIYHDKKDEPQYWRIVIYDPETAEKILEDSSFDAGTGITTVVKNNIILAHRNNKLISRITRTFDEKQQLTEELTEDIKGKRLYTYQYDDKGNIIMEERYQNGAIYFKVASQYDDNGLLQRQTVIDPENGAYMEFYDYVFYD